MDCKKCGAPLPPGANYCPQCGRALAPEPRTRRRRGNGQGTVVPLPNGKYKAVIITGWYLDDAGKKHRRTRSLVCEKKKDAVAALVSLRETPKQARKKSMTFKALFDAWLPTHRAGRSTLDCYRAAVKHFRPIWTMQLSEIDIDDLQDCLDSCPHGRRTKENMKACCSLMYKYGIPRHVIPDNLNLAQYLIVDGDPAAHRSSFTDIQLEQIRRACGTVPGAEDILVMCYTGFRPSEYLALTDKSYSKKTASLRGGSKTEAGKDRTVPLSPKIKPIIDARAQLPGPLSRNPSGQPWDLKDFTELLFYPALQKIGIANPLVEISGGKLRHQYTPHTCRHTFSTLMKRVTGSDKDKLALIGHTSTEMLRYYQDAPINDLRKITDAL